MASKRPPNRIETTPAGFEVAFWDEIGLDGKPQQRRYRVGLNKDGERVPAVEGEKFVSTSTISGQYEKHGLMPAAVKLTEAGVIDLAKDGVNIAALTPEELRAAMVKRGTFYDSIWAVARERGKVAHDHLLHLLRDGKVARLSDYAKDLRPWIQAGMTWFVDVAPEVFDAETIVVSTEHGFAGRYDLCCQLRDGRTARVDFKTVTEWKCVKNSKGESTDKLLPPYDENLIQLDGYEIAGPESGYPEAEVAIVVRLGPDGGYDVYEFEPRPEAFLAALTAYNEKRDRKTGKKAKREAVPA